MMTKKEFFDQTVENLEKNSEVIGYTKSFDYATFAELLVIENIPTEDNFFYNMYCILLKEDGNFFIAERTEFSKTFQVRRI